MSYDLRRELDALAAEERTAAGALPVDDLRARAHRRRTTRSVAASALAVAAVAAVAVAAVALPDRGTTPPAETTTPTRTPTTPDATPAAWPPAVTLDGLLPGCGEPMPALAGPDGGAEPAIAVEPIIQGTPLVAGGVGELEVTVTGPADLRYVAQVPRVILTRAGVVVGGANLGPGDDGFRYTSADGTLTYPSLLVDLTDCGGDPLAAGAYDVFVAVPLERGTVDAPVAGELVLAGGPYPITLEPAGPPALEDLVISTSGLGPLLLGAEVDAAPLVRLDASACAGTDLPARWVADYPDEQNPLGAPSAPFGIAHFENRVMRIEVHTPGPRTTGGVQVGDDLAALRAAHPELARIATTDDLGVVEAWGLQEGERTLAVEVSANPSGDAFWADAELGRVVAIVATSGIPYTYPAWGTDSCG